MSLPPSSTLVRCAWLLLASMAVLSGCGEEKPAEKPKTEAGRKAPQQEAKLPRGKGFDFYVLSLSWSPTWCAGNDSAGKTQQCRRGENNGFIVHGLWPQNERGYPEYCPTREPDRVPESLGRTVLDIIPSMGLIGHQWRKHGSCSGLGQKDYFAVTRAAFERIRIPAEMEAQRGSARLSPDSVEETFIAANPGLDRKGIAVTCEDGRLEEVRICMNADLSFRACPAVDRAACRARSIEQLPAR
ncbi:ribonuclease T2 family protein [Shinella zoogloeoides]|uniref:ribonuclease T2 family protein n=1 Tax=Shinella zoogloeoides TaxID=352475 RepID=UPI00273FDDF8|nr:ribonuclease T(2) [Shinella zoogloeoides]WLR93837.1 ribonuclease T(2) [Shinella zoogloeoides]